MTHTIAISTNGKGQLGHRYTVNAIGALAARWDKHANPDSQCYTVCKFFGVTVGNRHVQKFFDWYRVYGAPRARAHNEQNARDAYHAAMSPVKSASGDLEPSHAQRVYQIMTRDLSCEQAVICQDYILAWLTSGVFHKPPFMVDPKYTAESYWFEVWVTYFANPHDRFITSA